MTYHAQFDLTGKVALVTGGAGLLGPEHAAALAHAGAIAVVTDVNGAAAEDVAVRLGKEFGADRVVALPMDVTDSGSIARTRESLLKRFGRVDILVNNAAIDPKVKADSLVETSRFEHFPLEQWDFQIRVGLTGALLCSQAFGGWMAANGGGVILNIASDLSVFAPDQRIYRKDGLPEDRQPVKPVTYSIIKTGLVGLTRYLATYWADKKVRVNALSPGGVYVNQPESFVQKLTNLIPLGRMARRDEYRGTVQFLCSEASSYMTGQNIVVDGGRSVW
ncbi:MAG: SDR family oxidoreductase [Gammaproteobacteria bacterium]|nr:MAG: SDR family oxidoreductase [Gammaproteobacteria bacterium]